MAANWQERPGRSRVAVAAVALIVVSGLTAHGQQEEKRPEQSETIERSGVALLLLDVNVTDKRGAPIHGLTRDDFIVQLNGRDWPIYSVDDLCPTGPVDVARSSDATDSSSVAADSPHFPTSTEISETTEPVLAPIRFVIYLDFSMMQTDGRSRGLAAARRFIRETRRPQEEVSIVAYSVLAGVRTLSPFTTDSERLLAALDTAEDDPQLVDVFSPLIHLRLDECWACASRECAGEWCKPASEMRPCWICCPMCLYSAQKEYSHGLKSLRALRTFLETLETVPGRKALLFFQQNSTFYPARPYKVPNIKIGDQVALADAIGAEATLSHTAIYSAALGDPLGVDPASDGSINFGANLAEFSGGDYGLGLTDLDRLLDRAGREEDCVYRIGLRQLDARSGVPIRAKVFVRNKPLPHRYRVQFLDNVDRWWRSARAALRDPERHDDVRVVAAIVPLARRGEEWDLSIQVAVEVETLTLLPTGEHTEAEWEVGALLSRNDGRRSWEMLARSRLRASSTSTVSTILHERRFKKLPPGEYRLGAFVRDRTDEALGACDATLVIPKTGDGTIVGPILRHADREVVRASLPLVSEKKGDATHTANRTTGAVPVAKGPIARGDPLQIETWVCSGHDGELLRFLSAGSKALFRFDSRGAKAGESCRHVIDPVETSALEPGEYSYHLRAVSAGVPEPSETTITFEIVDGESVTVPVIGELRSDDRDSIGP